MSVQLGAQLLLAGAFLAIAVAVITASLNRLWLPGPEPEPEDPTDWGLY
jgi:hypothetical protein